MDREDRRLVMSRNLVLANKTMFMLLVVIALIMFLLLLSPINTNKSQLAVNFFITFFCAHVMSYLLYITEGIVIDLEESHRERKAALAAIWRS